MHLGYCEGADLKQHDLQVAGEIVKRHGPFINGPRLNELVTHAVVEGIEKGRAQVLLSAAPHRPKKAFTAKLLPSLATFVGMVSRTDRP